MGGQCLTNFEPAGTACGDLTDDECTNPDTCDGAGLCSANNAPVGTACGDPTDGDCTDPDACDGAGLCQQNNSPIGAACGDSSNNDCTDPDTCNGAGICLDNHEADGLTCDDCPAGPGMCATCAAGACPDALVCTSAYALPTTFASNGALDGNMFDVRVLSTTISITSIDVNLNTGTHTIEIWYRSGSYLGYEETPAGWNLLTMVSGVTSNGPDVATPVPVSPNLVIPAGGTYALYITTQTSGGMRYTGSTDEGSVYASDTRIEILEGVGKQWPFSGTLRPRVFNGTLHYRVCP